MSFSKISVSIPFDGSKISVEFNRPIDFNEYLLIRQFILNCIGDYYDYVNSFSEKN